MGEVRRGGTASASTGAAVGGAGLARQTQPEPPDFDELYRLDADPWQVATSWYERRKLGVVLASLTRERYANAWDPACGTGHLALRLASICGRVLATDASARAVELSRRACAGAVGVRVAVSRLPGEPPESGPFELIALSEFWYYLTVEQRASALETIERLAAPNGEVVAVHWRHRPHDAYLSGAEAQNEIVETLTAAGWRAAIHHSEDDFVLNVIRHGRSDG